MPEPVKFNKEGKDNFQWHYKPKAERQREKAGDRTWCYYNGFSSNFFCEKNRETGQANTGIGAQKYSQIIF